MPFQVPDSAQLEQSEVSTTSQAFAEESQAIVQAISQAFAEESQAIT